VFQLGDNQRFTLDKIDPIPNPWKNDHAELASKSWSIFNKQTKRIMYHADHLSAISTYDNKVVVGGVVYDETRTDRQARLPFFFLCPSLLTV
jgi:hypothetical protein